MQLKSFKNGDVMELQKLQTLREIAQNSLEKYLKFIGLDDSKEFEVIWDAIVYCRDQLNRIEDADYEVGEGYNWEYGPGRKYVWLARGDCEAGLKHSQKSSLPLEADSHMKIFPLSKKRCEQQSQETTVRAIKEFLDANLASKYPYFRQQIKENLNAFLDLAYDCQEREEKEPRLKQLQYLAAVLQLSCDEIDEVLSAIEYIKV